MISAVDTTKCSGCGACTRVCPYKAITLEEIDSREVTGWVKRKAATVNSGLCQGCGACNAACHVGAIDLRGFTNAQILKEVDALCL